MRINDPDLCRMCIICIFTSVVGSSIIIFRFNKYIFTRSDFSHARSTRPAPPLPVLNDNTIILSPSSYTSNLPLACLFRRFIHDDRHRSKIKKIRRRNNTYTTLSQFTAPTNLRGLGRNSISPVPTSYRYFNRCMII